MKLKTTSQSFSALTGILAICCLASARAGAPEAFSDDFSAPELSKEWAAAKGSWTVEDGKLKGLEVAADKHAAVLTHLAPHTDSKVSFSFQLAGSQGFHLSFNHPKGHLFRVLVSESDVTVSTDVDKKDPASKSVLLDRKAASIEQGKPHTLTCETRGETVTVTIDKDLKLAGSHPSLANGKTGYRLIVKGDGVLFDDFVVSN